MSRIYKYIARQFGNPTGFGGKIATFYMNRINQKLYRAVIENIDIRETDTILEIGFGNGYLIRRLSDENPLKMYGIDISSDMLNSATKKNRKKIEQGKIQLSLADVQDLSFEESSIDKAYTVNTVYFWQDLHKGLSEIKRILKPGGMFLNVFYLKEMLDKLPMTQYGFSKYTVEQIERAINDSGLKINRIIEDKPYVCVVAKK